MKRKRALYSALCFAVVLGLGVIAHLPGAEALTWQNWTSSATGDVSEYSLGTYWTVISSPISGYESYLWSSWHDVVDSNVDYYDNGDNEILFSTWFSTSTMGTIEFESKADIEDAKDLVLRGRFGVKYTYPQVKTIGRVEIYDKTDQVSVWKEDIKSGTTANSWKWQSFSSGTLSVNRYHDYVIKLVAKDAWIQQKVQVAWESAEVWFHTPYYRTLSHGPDTWRHEGWWHYYECRWRSDFYFLSGPLEDMVRDHRPYVVDARDPTGWDPCYVHEFRSVPYYTLEGDWWFSTDLPETIGYTNAAELEEMPPPIGDGYEEIEIYTRNPESLIAGHAYYISHRYTVWETGSVTMTLESELCNEADPYAELSPPGYPVGYVDISSRQVSHSSKSYFGWWFAAAGDSASDGMNQTTTSIDYRENHRTYTIRLKGEYPYYLKAYTQFKIDSREDFDSLMNELRSDASDNYCNLLGQNRVPATISFSRLMSIDDVCEIVDTHDLNLNRFRFTAAKENEVIRGQGTSRPGTIIPLEELEAFIEGYDILGIQSIDVEMSPEIAETLADAAGVLAVDVSAISAILDLGLRLSDFHQIQWFVEDPSWFLD
jgi:hypothetical protein